MWVGGYDVHGAVHFNVLVHEAQAARLAQFAHAREARPRPRLRVVAA
jgi:hypothetical protein